MCNLRLRIKRKWCSTLFFFVLSGCSKDFDALCREGHRIQEEMVVLLENSTSREDLEQSETELRHLFDQLVDVLIDISRYREEYPCLPIPTIETPCPLLPLLRRVEYIDGAQEIIESCQKNALYRLNHYLASSTRALPSSSSTK